MNFAQPMPLRLVAILQTDCPTCRLITPYLNALAEAAPVSAISQDSEPDTAEFARQMSVRFPLTRDPDFALSKRFGVVTVPTLYVLDENDRVLRQEPGFDKNALNEIAALLHLSPVATPFDGAPPSKPGCTSRHLESPSGAPSAPALDVYATRGDSASQIHIDEDEFEYCFRVFKDALPVIPPTPGRVEKMLHAACMQGRDPREIVARVPPCYGAATVEKIAANAVMAGCVPEMMRVLIPLARAVADERFNAHGVQATTHFAAPLIIVNGPVRGELAFHSRQNVFSNVARSNSTLGRALQLMLLNLGGARPDAIDMSALGNPGKFSFCIAENEEENPWQPLHLDNGLARDQSAVTLFAGEAPHGVSEHNARTARGVLKAISYALATVWSYRACMNSEALVVLAPEHVRTIHRDGFTKENVRDFLFENTGIPLRCYDGDPGEGVAQRALYQQITIDGEPCYQKFRAPQSIKIVVAGGTAGKFSAVLGSWAAGPRGSQMVTYPV